MKAKQLIRENFRNEVFKRDGYKCRVCKTSGVLDAHHITDRNEMPNGGYTKSNGVSLCPKCHLLAEEYHITDGQKCGDGYRPEQLYTMIGSSYNEAWRDSIRISPK